jgi:integrase
VRVRLKGINSLTKTLADGTRKTYWYAWKGGPPLPGKPGDPEFIAAYYAAHAKKIAPLNKGDLSEVLDKFQDGGEFRHAIGERTRRDYIWQIKRIESRFADFPIKALDDPKARAVFREWRDELAKTSLRQADYAYNTLAHILKWALERGLVGANPCAGGSKLYQGTRVDKVWPDEKIEAFMDVAPLGMLRAMMLAINTGQRQGDLRRLTWTAYDGKVIKIRQRKTGAYVPVPVSDELKAVLDATPRVSPFILVNSKGRPWGEASFQWAWRKASLRAGIEDLTFHDLRGTAVVWLARAGCSVAEIYAITGHKPGDVQAILTAHYLPRDGEVAANAIAKLNAYRQAQKGNKSSEKFPTALPTALKIVGSGTEEVK